MSTTREREKTKARHDSAKAFLDTPPGREQTCIKPPPGYEYFKFKGGMIELDFLPYKVKSKHNRRADVGYSHCEREYNCHRVPVAGGRNLYVCRGEQGFGLPCAICDWMQKNSSTADDQLMKDLSKRTRNLWLVNDDPGNTKNKPKVMDQVYYNRKQGFGEQMFAAVKSFRRANPDVDPFGLEGGYTAILNVEENTWPGGKNMVVTRIDFKKRNYDYPESVLIDGILDDSLIDPGYDKLMAILNGGEVEEEEEKEETTKATHLPVASRKPSVPPPEEEDDDDEMDSDLEDDE